MATNNLQQTSINEQKRMLYMYTLVFHSHACTSLYYIIIAKQNLIFVKRLFRWRLFSSVYVSARMQTQAYSSLYTNITVQPLAFFSTFRWTLFLYIYAKRLRERAHTSTFIIVHYYNSLYNHLFFVGVYLVVGA